jgi:cytoskeletal protein RodZ
MLKTELMSTVAEQLRTSREAQGLTVYQVAEITKIRTDHIRALEEGKYEAFAAPVYLRGFVRTYATLLKLDVPGMMSRLEAELSQTDKFQELSPMFDEPRGFLDVVVLQLAKVDWRLALPSLGVALALLMAILGYRAWRAHRSKDPLANLGPGIYQPAEKQSGETLPLPPATQPKK